MGVLWVALFLATGLLVLFLSLQGLVRLGAVGVNSVPRLRLLLKMAGSFWGLRNCKRFSSRGYSWSISLVGFSDARRRFFVGFFCLGLGESFLSSLALEEERAFWAAIFSLDKDSSNSNNDKDSLALMDLFRSRIVLALSCLKGQVDSAVISSLKSFSLCSKRLHVDSESALNMDFFGVSLALDLCLLTCFLATNSGMDSWVLRLSTERLPREKSSEFLWIFIGDNSVKVLFIVCRLWKLDIFEL